MPLRPCRRCGGQLHPDHGRGCLHCGHGQQRRRRPRVDEREEAAHDLGHIHPGGSVAPGRFRDRSPGNASPSGPRKAA